MIMADDIYVRRNPGRIKFGYKLHPTEPSLMIPDEELLAVQDEAFGYIRRGYSLREISNWIFHQTGIHFDYSALRKAYLRTRREKHGRKPRLTDMPSNSGSTEIESSKL